MMDADGTMAAIAQGWGAVYDLDGTVIERRDFERKKLTYEVVKLPPEKPEPRTLIGGAAGVIASTAGLGYAIEGCLYPKAWALDGRWAEARVGACGGVLQLPGSERAVTAKMSLLGGIGRR